MSFSLGAVESKEDGGLDGSLFDTLSEAHYLPELTLSGPHDEALLQSLVEKGCEDNQVLGQALAHLVHDYDEERSLLLTGEPVADMIDRMEQSLGSPRTSHENMSAAHGLLTLHQRTPHAYATDQSYVSNAPADCSGGNPTEVEVHSEIGMEYVNSEDLQTPIAIQNANYTDHIPEVKGECELSDSIEPTLQLPEDIRQPSESAPDVHCDISEQIEEPLEPEETGVRNDKIMAPEVATIDFEKELEAANEELVPTDLSVKHTKRNLEVENIDSGMDSSHTLELSSKFDEMSNPEESLNGDEPRDLTVARRLTSPLILALPLRAPSRESDTMQSPQPSGIPALPSSPELFTVPQTKSKQTLFLESLLSSPSPKMYTSEVTITKQQCEPLNLGKHRKSASPTVSSCSDDIRKLNKDYGEPHEKRIRRESTEDLAKISKVFIKSNADQVSQCKQRQLELRSDDENSPMKQLQILKDSPAFKIPDPLFLPKNKLNDIVTYPQREIPALLINRPELRLPEVFAYPALFKDPDICMVTIAQLEAIIEDYSKPKKTPEPKLPKITNSKNDHTQSNKTDQTSQQKALQSEGLAGDIEAATSAAALSQMMLLSRIEAAMTCSQNVDFLKALNSSGYANANYSELSQMIANHPSRFMGSGGLPTMQQVDYESRLQFAMWQEEMSQQHAKQRSKNAAETQMKEFTKSADVQNPYVHSTKNNQSKQQNSSARTSPIGYNYNNLQRGAMQHNLLLQGMYPSMNPNIIPNVPLPGLQIPYFNPNMAGSQRSPRNSQQKSPISPYFQNNNYLPNKQSDGHQRSSSRSSQESPRPRISVKSIQNLMEPSAAASSGSRRHHGMPSMSASPLSRQRDEPEVGSTTPLGEPPRLLQQHPHDPSLQHHLWHPLFGNQKNNNSPWSWTTVTATGD